MVNTPLPSRTWETPGGGYYTETDGVFEFHKNGKVQRSWPRRTPTWTVGGVLASLRKAERRLKKLG